jgi:hypothetical protein
MTKKSIFSKIAALVSCSVLASSSTVSMIANASSADSNWSCSRTSLASYLGGDMIYRQKDNDSSVYISNWGQQIYNGYYQYNVKTARAFNFAIVGAVGYYDISQKKTVYSLYDIENRSGRTSYFCGGGAWQPDLTISANDTRVIYQYISENYNSAKKDKGLSGKPGVTCYAGLEVRSGNSCGVWSPDTSGNYYKQIDGQGFKRGTP